MLKEIAQFIEDLSVGPPWEIGVNLFEGWLPQTDKNEADIPDRCMVILERTPGGTVPEFPDRVDKMIQIWNRNISYFTARDDAQELYAEIHGMKDGSDLPTVEESGYMAMVIEAQGDPAPIENPDEKGFFVFSTNFLFRIKNPP